MNTAMTSTAMTEHSDIEDIRSILEEIHDGDISHEEGLEAIRELVGSEGHDDHGDHGDHDEHDHGEFDPHVWLDPVLAVQQVVNITGCLDGGRSGQRQHIRE